MGREGEAAGDARLGSGAIAVVLWFFVSRLLRADAPLLLKAVLFVAVGAAIGIAVRRQMRGGNGVANPDGPEGGS